MQTLKDRVLWHLERAKKPLAVHELRDLIGNVNENNLATRLSEYAKEGLVIGKQAEGKMYKVWELNISQTLFDLNNITIVKRN